VESISALERKKHVDALRDMFSHAPAQRAAHCVWKHTLDAYCAAWEPMHRTPSSS
jgi:hypothetical protein